MRPDPVSQEVRDSRTFLDRFQPCTKADVSKGISIDPPSAEYNYQMLKDFSRRFGVVCRHKGRLVMYADPNRLLQQDQKTKVSKKKEESWWEWVIKLLGKNIGTIVTTVVGGVLTWLIIRWLKKRKGGDDGDDKKQEPPAPPPPLPVLGEKELLAPLEEKSDFTDESVPQAKSTNEIEEVTLVKRRPPEIILPEVRLALVEGFSDEEWGKLLFNIIRVRFKGEDKESVEQADQYLKDNFGIDWNDLLGHPSITGHDVYNMMCRSNGGGIGLGVNDSLQVSLLWAIKECGVTLKGKSSYEASEDFIALASKYKGRVFKQKGPEAPLSQLLDRVNYQLRVGCKFVHEYALISHLARYLRHDYKDEQLNPLMEELIRGSGYKEAVEILDQLDLGKIIPREHKNETSFVTSLKKVIMARLKYFQSLTGTYKHSDQIIEILESAYGDVSAALGMAQRAYIGTKSYMSYIKGVASDIRSRSISLKSTGSGGSGPPRSPSGTFHPPLGILCMFSCHAFIRL